MVEAIAFLIFSLLIAYAIYHSVKHDDVDQWRKSTPKRVGHASFGANPRHPGGQGGESEKERP